MIRYPCRGQNPSGASHRLDSATAERLLRGERIAPEHHQLAAVLSAAADPGQPAELSGRSAALAAFQAAALLPAPRSHRASTMRSSLLKLLTVKAMVLAAFAVGTCGIALAASTGVLSGPSTGHTAGHTASRAASPATPSTAASTASPAASASSVHRSPSASPAPPTHPTNPAGSPSSSLVVLCRAYTAMVDASAAAGGNIDLGAALSSPTFRPLVTAAGGQDKVGAFCAKLPDPPPNSDPAGDLVIGGSATRITGIPDDPSTRSVP